jgi:hypothetical protein
MYCKRCAAGRGAIYACQLGDGSRRRALQAIRLRHFLNGYAGLKPTKPPLMHRATFTRLTNQLRQLEAKGITKHQAKAVHSLGHRIVKPTQMYRTQTASIATA